MDAGARRKSRAPRFVGCFGWLSLLCAWLFACAPRPAAFASSSVPASKPQLAAPAPKPQPPVQPSSEQLLATCKSAFGERRFTDADTACRAATKADPGSAEAHSVLAHALFNLGRREEALSEAERVVAMQPDWPEPYVIVGGIKQASGEMVEAMAAYRRYLELAPNGSYADDIRAIVDQAGQQVCFPPDAPLVWPATVTRVSATPEHRKSATVSAGLPRPVKVGDILTVIPMRRGIPPIDLKATSVRAQAATDLTPALWLVEAETELDAFLTAAPDPGRRDHDPFGVIVIYPQRSLARLIPQKFVKRDLPKANGASLRTLWSAVDIDGDGAVDVEIFRFCCDHPSRPSRTTGPSPCQSDCENTYLRSKGRPWSLVNEESEF